MLFDDPLTLALIASGVVIACLVAVFVVRRRGKKIKKAAAEKAKVEQDLAGLPFKIVKSVPQEHASQAKDELRTLDLEREILSDAIRKLYEAHAEGKISEQERERLAETYKRRMMAVKDAISKDESLVALNELETMQEDLMKLFSERFDELSTKIEELRLKTDVEPVKEITIAPKKAVEETSVPEEEKAEKDEKAKKKRKPAEKPSQRTEAEKRIEEIREEVEKVLDRLGQMEIES